MYEIPYHDSEIELNSLDIHSPVKPPKSLELAKMRNDSPIRRDLDQIPQSESSSSHKKKKAKSVYGINPYHPARRFWEYVMFILSELIFWFIPYEWIFDFDLTFFWVLPSLIIDMFFFADIYVSSRTGFMNFGIVELDKEFIQHYIPTWRKFIYWATPWPYYLIGFFLNNKLAYRITNTFEAIKLVRMYDAYITIRRDIMSTVSISRIFILFTILLTVIHVFSCFLWLTGTLQPPGQSWIDVAEIRDKSQIIQYFHTYYYVTTTVLTIGYGDIHPYSFPEICFVIVIEAVGTFYYNFLVANLVSIVADPTRTAFINRYQKIYSYFHQRGVSEDIMHEILRYIDYTWENDRDQADFYQTAQKLPESLQKKIAVALHMEIFNKVPAFKNLPLETLEEIGFALRPRIFTPGDFLLKAGQVSNKVYFVTVGKVDVLNAFGSFIKSFDGSTGTVFGESSFLNGTEEVTCVIAETYVEAYELLKEDFDAIEGIRQIFINLRRERGPDHPHIFRHEFLNANLANLRNPV